MSQTRAQPRRRPARHARTLWEEGRRPGRQVVALSTATVLAAAGANVGLADELSVYFDLVFAAVCLAAALAVRPRDFFVVGMLPPLLMLGTITLLAAFFRASVADEVDNLVQAVVSGLAHRAGGLVAGYSVALAVLALRQVARRNAGRLRRFA
ncbi:MAG TPA: DUF6542 domain-containing protein [Nocardioidaceae bacterium]|nr:DUF6542 domain-containing protein [Nocardioidaceae bacterium]